jgi:hypothetical protein
MRKKSYALLGPGRGPRIATGGRECRVVCSGAAGEEMVLLHHYPCGTIIEIPGGGEALINAAEYVAVEYLGKNRAFAAHVMLGG